VDNTIAAYLTTGALPRRLKANRADRRCKAIAPPDPTPGTLGPAPKSTESAAVRTRLELQKLIR
jgi:hypothetical protein